MSKDIVLLVTTRYSKDDPECLSDYCEVVIQLDGEEVARYGDHTRDRGREKAEGWVDALETILPTIKVEWKDVADYEL